MVELGLALSIFGAVLAYCPWSAEPFMITKLAAALIGALLSLTALWLKPRAKFGNQHVPIFIWSFVLLASFVFSCDPFLSVIGGGDSSAGTLSSFLTMALVLCAAQLSGIRGEKLEAYCVVACYLCAGYAIVQKLGYDPLFSTFEITGRFGGRSFSTMGGPVLLGPVLAAALPLSVAASWRRGGFAWGLPAVILVGLLVAGTRAATGGALAGVALLAYLTGRIQPRTAALGAGAAVLIAALSRAGVVTSDLGRLAIWKISWLGFLERPLIGWGANTFILVMRRHIGADYLSANGAMSVHGHAHNFFLQTLFSHGLLGLAAMALIGVYAWVLWRSRRLEDSAAIGALLAVLLCAQTNPVPMSAWLIVLVCLAPLMGARAAAPQLPRSATLAAAALAGLLLVVQVRLIRADAETLAGRRAWIRKEGLAAANHYNRAARLNPWSTDTVVNQLDSSRNLVPWMGPQQAAQTAKDGLAIAQRLVKRHPADARAHEVLSAQLSLSALLADGLERQYLLGQAEHAIEEAGELAPTYQTFADRQKVIVANAAAPQQGGL